MAWLISDANIIIDMEGGRILELMFKLSATFIVPDVLYVEELAEHHPELPGLGLKVKRLRQEFIKETYHLREIYTEPSTNDLMALALAKQENCPLLTGDRALRHSAEQEEVEVKGTIWIMQQLYEQGLMTIDAIEQSYDLMKEDGRRLPWNLVNDQIQKLKKGQ